MLLYLLWNRTRIGILRYRLSSSIGDGVIVASKILGLVCAGYSKIKQLKNIKNNYLMTNAKPDRVGVCKPVAHLIAYHPVSL